MLRHVRWEVLWVVGLVTPNDHASCGLVEGRAGAVLTTAGSGACTVIAIRDRKRHGWVLYPHGVAGLGVLIADDAAHLLADRIGSPA